MISRCVAAETTAGAYGATDSHFYGGGYSKFDNQNYASTNSGYYPSGYARSKQDLDVYGGYYAKGSIGHKTGAGMDYNYGYYPDQKAGEYGYASFKGGYGKTVGGLESDGWSRVYPTSASAGHKMEGKMYSSGYGTMNSKGGAAASSGDNYN